MLTTWTTIPMLDRLLTDVMNDVTGTAFGTKAQSLQGAFQPAIDVRANDDEIVLVCYVSGLREKTWKSPSRTAHSPCAATARMTDRRATRCGSGGATAASRARSRSRRPSTGST